MLRTCLLSIAFVFIGWTAPTQNICRIASAEGLSNSSILSLGQDANGYIWAGSCDGINLWDGTYARNYKLSGNLVQEIIPTADGYLWVRTNYGLDRVDIRDGSSVPFADYPRMYKMAARSRNEVFFIYGDRLYGYVASKEDFETADVPEVDMRGVLRMSYAPDGVLWLIYRDRILFAQVSHDAGGRARFARWEKIPMPGGIAYPAYDGQKSIYFLDSKRGLYCFDTTRRRAVFIYNLYEEIARRGTVSSVVRDKDDYVVAFGMSGAIRLHATTRIEGEYVVREIDVDCGVFSMLKDRNQDIVWIGTDGSGLLRQSDGDVTIRTVTYNSLPYRLTKPVKALHVDDRGALWIGTKNDGILRIDDFYAARSYTRENTHNFTASNSALRHNSVYRFAPSRRNVVWIAGDGGVCYYSFRDQKIHVLPSTEQLVRVHVVLESNDSTLWAATVGRGVYRIDLAGSADAPVATHVECLDLGPEVESTNFFFAIHRQCDSVLWFGNHGVGSIRYDLTKRRGEVVRFDGLRGNAVNDVTAITHCSDGTLWFATGCGVEHCDREGRPLPTPDYNHDILRNGVIHGLVADSLDNVWISTNAGIVRYTPGTNRSVSYGASYGLGVVEFSDEAYYYDRSAGKLLFGGINGFVVISDTESPSTGTYMPPVQFRELTANGSTHDVAGLMRRGRMRLNHRQSAFSLSLAALDYINGSNFSYLYKIVGLDDRWTDNRHSNQLVFANLPAGRYRIDVRYRNNMTGELSPVYSLDVRMLPPAYASWWAWTLYMLVVACAFSGGAMYWIRRRRERQQQRRAFYEQRQKELLYESRIASLANLTSELSVPLTLIDGPCQQIMDYKSTDGFVHRQAEFIQRNAQKLNDLIFMLNEFKTTAPAELANGIELLDVSRFAESVALTFGEYARSNEVPYRTSVEDDLLFPSDRNALTVVLNILLNNAFRRTMSDGEVIFRVSIVDQLLRIVVSNRGKSLDPDDLEQIFDRYRMFDYFEDQGRKGLSLKDGLELAICRNLVGKLQGAMRVESEGEMTTLMVEFPRLEITRTTLAPVRPDYESQRRFNLPALSARPASEHSASLPTMLVINDDRDMTEFIADLFAETYNVHIINELRAVSGQLNESHPHIIVCGTVALDGGMAAVIRQIRSNRHLAQIPVILLTAAPHADAKIEGLELGVDICLTLPFNIVHLRSVADQLLRKYDSLKDYGRSAFNAFDLTQGRMLHKDDRAFLDRMLEVIHKNILNTGLSTQFIAGEMGMSLCNLYRRLGGVTDQTPAGIIREYRLCLAEKLLLTTKLSIDEIIYKSGFVNRSTFFRSFTARFGSTPKAYREQKIREVIDSEAV